MNHKHYRRTLADSFELEKGAVKKRPHEKDPILGPNRKPAPASKEYEEKLKLYLKSKGILKSDTAGSPQFKRGDTGHSSTGVIDPKTGANVINKDKRYVVHGASKYGQPAHWLVPEGEKDSRKGFYHRADRIHPIDKSSDMQKMSRPRITFPNFPEITNRPDQNVKLLETERQKKLYGRQVANAEHRDRKVEKPVRLSGSRTPIRSKNELIDAHGKRVAGKFGRTVLGTSYNTPQGPKSAVLAGRLRSKFEEGDDTDKAKLDAYKANVAEAQAKYQADMDAWRKKTDQLPAGSTEYWNHVGSRPKYKAPRRPAKSLKDTKDLSPEKMALRGKAVDSTIEHEGFHDLMAHVENKYGPVASSTLVRDLISQHHPEAIGAVRNFVLDTMNYNERSPRFNEELITHARDILVNPIKRERFKTYLQNKLGLGKDSIISDHIKKLKQGHQKAYNRAKEISLADIRPDLAEKPEKLATSEMAKAREDKSLPAAMRQKYRAERRKFSTDPLEAQLTSKPGVSERGIEVRRGDSRVSGAIAHGYARTGTPQEHKEKAKRDFKQLGDIVRDMKKPRLTKNEAAEIETEKIRENKKSPAAKNPHKFKPAKYTHPNGHPRCLICGDEERTGGWCSGVENE
jgi:hypothetical protein